MSFICKYFVVFKALFHAPFNLILTYPCMVNKMALPCFCCCCSSSSNWSPSFPLPTLPLLWNCLHRIARDLCNGFFSIYLFSPLPLLAFRTVDNPLYLWYFSSLVLFLQFGSLPQDPSLHSHSSTLPRQVNPPMFLGSSAWVISSTQFSITGCVLMTPKSTSPTGF